MSLRIHWPLASILACGLALIVLTRLPQFLGGRLVPDGDECVVGIMAKHLLEGRTFPFFYYGQNYGFSLVEAWMTALFFFATGISAAALKGAMLCLWAVGWIFLVLAMRNFAGVRAAAIAGMLLIICPAWNIWSMKARGGYLTAFVLANLFLFLLSLMEKRTRGRDVTIAAMGACLGLAYFSMALWVVALLPFVAHLFWKYRSPRNTAFFLVGVAAAVLPLLWIRAGIVDVSWSIQTFANQNVPLMIKHLPFAVWAHFNGVYPFSNWYDAGPATKIAATLWTILFAGMLILFFRRAARREFFTIRQAAMLSCILAAGVTLFINTLQFGFRYLLPVSAFLIVALCLELDKMLSARFRNAVLGLLAALALAASGSFVELARVPVIIAAESPQKVARRDAVAMRALIDKLESAGIGNVYCFNPMFNWNIIFASEEKIRARSTEPGGRRAEYGFHVDVALLSGEKVGVIGTVEMLPELKKFLAREGYGEPEIWTIEDTFIVIPNPTPKMVAQLGFRLNDPKALETLLFKWGKGQ